MTREEAEWHACVKPSFATNGTFVYAASGPAPTPSGLLTPAMPSIVGEHKDVRFAKFVTADDINPLSLLAQKEITNIDISGGFPVANAPREIVFASLAENVDTGVSIAKHEKAVWQLCSILFDPSSIACEKYRKGIPEDQVVQLEPRMRMDALGAFWAQLVAPACEERLKRARTAEEKALLHLTQNDIVAACEALISAKDFKLAVLISQLPGSEDNRGQMKRQIDAWRDRNVWSEMSEPVRALYSILAGELCAVEGKSGAPENRVAGFNIAEKFGLSWQQSFALRLYFGRHQTIEEAVQAYSADSQSNRERVRPISDGNTGPETSNVYMELLSLFAGNADPSKLLDPLTVSGNELNARLTWQLASLLDAKGCCALSNEQLDQITYAFATQLEVAGKFISGTWVLLHLRDNKARQRALMALLERCADSISTPGDGVRGTFEDFDARQPDPI